MCTAEQRDSGRRVTVGLTLILAAYLGTALAGWPRLATKRIVAQEQEERSDAAQHGPAATECPAFWMLLPFTLLLGAIALFPLLPRVSHWWDRNLHKFYVAGGLSLLTLTYYLVAYRQPILCHWPFDRWASPSGGWLDGSVAGAVFSNAILSEFFPFIVLLFSLYTISGGIRIEGDLKAHSLTNTAFLAIGAVLASLIGTTGAAMLLIRPLLETNRERKHVRHTVILFIFIVCNCGGCLLPLGDPPLFLGYLFGVPFLWTLKLWPAWLLVNGLLLTVYFLWDRFWFYPRETKSDIARDESEFRPMRLRGLWPNVFLLAGVILAVSLLGPRMAVPGTSWHAWVYLREAVQLGLVLLSLALSPGGIRRDNNFNYVAIVEVAALFVGIFLCMQPPLQILHVHGPSLGLVSPAHFFWASGSLSSVLDNAPTYAVFFQAAQSLGGEPAVAGVQQSLLAAVSLGSVFMGAMTYIGNGPNFMVKSIAEKSGVAMPSFFGYVVYSAVILLPLWILVTVLFL